MAEPFLSEIRIMSFVFAPKGWALCNGQLLPINQNQALFSLLGTTFGGDGRVNFALPDLRGAYADPRRQRPYARRARRGAGPHAVDRRAADPHARAERLENQPPSMRRRPPRCSPRRTRNSSTRRRAIWSPWIPRVVSNTGGSQAHLNMQPFLTLTFCIALQGIFPSRTRGERRWRNPMSARFGCSPGTSPRPAGCSAKDSCCQSRRTRHSSS